MNSDKELYYDDDKITNWLTEQRRWRNQRGQYNGHDFFDGEMLHYFNAGPYQYDAELRKPRIVTV